MDTGSSRRAFLRAAGAAAVGGLAGCTAPDGDDGTPSGTATSGDGTQTETGDGDGNGDATIPSAVGVETVATGLTSPVAFDAPAGVDQWVVADQPGRLYVYDGDQLRERPFLDLTDRVVDVGGYSERGLLGVAFHPEYADNGRFYVRYSAPRREGTPSGYSHTFVLSEFTADPGATTADASSERTVMEIPQPQANHNAGDIAFGPDGYLYVGTGDGGGANDTGTGHVSDWYETNGGGNGQDVTENLLGSVLRIDVDGRDGDKAYAVPDDNPLVGRDGLDEHWAWGLRNPWRLSFDGDDLYVADVGQNRFEEVNLVEKGGNYGWNVREGTHCFATSSPSSPPSDCPGITSDGERLRSPIIEYPHGGGAFSGQAVIGGYVYHGDALTGLDGRYVFADWRSGGNLFVATPVEQGLWPASIVDVRGTDAYGRFVLAFGRDQAGDLYVLTSNQGGVGGESGAVHRLRSTSG